MADPASLLDKHEMQNERCRRDLPTQHVDFAAMPNFHFEGLPETLIINLIIFSVLLGLFIAVRRSAWAASKLLNVAKPLGNLAGVVAAFYGPPAKTEAAHDQLSTESESQTKTSREASVVDSPARPTDELLAVHHGVEQHEVRFLNAAGSAGDIFKRGASGLIASINTAFNLQENQLREHCGQDAVDLMRFEQFLVVLSAILCVVSLGGILPVHLTGTLHRASHFARTTLANSDPHSGLLWIHVLLTVLLVPLVLLLIRKFLKLELYRTFLRPTRLTPYRTLMVCNVPSSAHNAELIRQHFAEAYPRVALERVDFSYASNRLARDIDARYFAGYCLEWVRAFKREHRHQHHQQTVSTRHCACLWQCCCADRAVDAEQYYQEKCSVYDRGLEQEVADAQRTPARVLFLTFGSHREAADVRADLGGLTFGLRQTKKRSSVSDKLGVAQWHPRFAPLPQHINWHTLNSGGWQWWLRLFILNAALLTLLFFFTTPTLLLNYLNDTVMQNSPILSQFVPMVLLLLISMFIFVMCQQVVSWTGYYSHIHENYVMMRNAFVYRLLIFLILPSLGLTTVKAIYQAFDAEHERQEWLVRRMYRQARGRQLDGGSGGYDQYYYGSNATSGFNETAQTDDDAPPQGVQWECIFLPSSGAFFVNFLITAALLDNILHLTRIGDFILYAARRCWARSDAERSARDVIPRFFAFPSAYASLLAFLSIDIAYAFISPLVTIFGLLFFVLKYGVDKYEMFFRSSPVAKRDMNLSMGLHTYAVRFVFWMLLIQQLLLMFFAILRGAYWPMPVVLGLVALVTLVFTLYVYFMAKFVDMEQVRVYRERLAGDGEAAAYSSSSSKITPVELLPVAGDDRKPMTPQVGGENEQRIAQNPLLNYKDPAFVAYRRLCSNRSSPIVLPYSMERYRGAKVDVPIPVL